MYAFSALILVFLGCCVSEISETLSGVNLYHNQASHTHAGFTFSDFDPFLSQSYFSFLMRVFALIVTVGVLCYRSQKLNT